MIALCIESSHQRGMGHFYRALNMFGYLRGVKVKEEAMFVINQDEASIRILEEKEIPYESVDYADVTSNWESKIIHKYDIGLWLLDKFETGLRLAQHVKKEGIPLAAIDGDGVQLADLHFCSMLFHGRRGKKVYAGKEYLILNPEIAKYRRQRTEGKKILITMGGSDTYGVTVKAVRSLKEQGYQADIIVGPNFKRRSLLASEIDLRFKVYESVPSLIAKFYEYDLAITGGGVTCFEANASGLPCLIIANELHEIETAEYLAGFGGAKFAGYHRDITEKSLAVSNLDIPEMSRLALQAVPLNGMENVYAIIRNYRSGKNAG